MNWNSTEFEWLDWLVLAIGVIAIVWAVYRSIKKDKEKMKGADSQDYLFGKGEPWYVIGMAIFAANIGSEHLVGLAGTGAKDGVGMAHWEMQGWMILILGWLFVPFYQLLNNKMGKIITMPDFLKFRYTQRTGSWLSIITLVAYILTKVSVTAFTGGIFFEYLIGLPFWWGALGLIAVTAIFTVFGGMKGVMTMSAIQTPILIIGAFAVLFLGLSTLGGGSIVQGWENMMAFCSTLHDGYGTTHMFHWADINASGAPDPLYHEYPGFVVFIGGQQKGESNVEVMKRARRGTIAAGYFKLLPVFMFLIPGMVAMALANGGYGDFGIQMDIANQHDTDGAFAMMVKSILPVGIKGFVTIGFICALVTSLAAFFNSCATLFTEDFYKPMKKGLSEAHYVLVGRIATVVVVILGLLWLPVMMGIIGMLRLVTNVITDTGSAQMDGAFWDATAWFWQTNWLVFECWLLVFIVLLMVCVSFFTPAPTAEQKDAITFTADYRKQIAQSWDVWDIVGTLGVLFLCGCFYWYFF